MEFSGHNHFIALVLADKRWSHNAISTKSAKIPRANICTGFLCLAWFMSIFLNSLK